MWCSCGVRLGEHLEKECLVGREMTLEPEDQGQEEKVPEESSLVALGRRRKSLL